VFITAADQKLSEVQIETIIFISSSCILLVACACLAIFPVVLMEKSRRQVWEAFFAAPVGIIRSLVQEYNDRISLISGENNG
jgi:hypothetical protein